MDDASLRTRELLISAGPSIQEIEVLFNLGCTSVIGTIPVIDKTACINVRLIHFCFIYLFSGSTAHKQFILPILAPSFFIILLRIVLGIFLYR